MFLQVSEHYTPFSALYTIFGTSPILSHITNNWGSSDDKTFFAKSKMLAFKNKKRTSSAPTLEQ
jgi:hypothetical protein